MYLLGISAYYHDSAAALIRDGIVVAAAQEERFTRKKHDSKFPLNAVKFCLDFAGIQLADVEAVVFYDKPLVKFERLLETYLAFAPRGLVSFITAMPIWLKEKLFIKRTLRQELEEISCGARTPKILFAEHHQSHAASAFFPSPFEDAAVLCMDGVGEWATTSVWSGRGRELRPEWQIDFPHSLGLLYSAFTYYSGFKVNSGEYKLMGLAPYGEPRFVDTILKELIDLKDDGTFRLNMDYFAFATGLTMTNDRFSKLFGAPPRKPEDKLTQREMDIARSIQWVTEEVVLRLGRTVHAELGTRSLCLAGGVALNCVANGRLLREGPFANIWIQPAAGDAGGALGAALAAWHGHFQKPRTVVSGSEQADGMYGGYLGPGFQAETIAAYFQKVGAKFQRLPEADVTPVVSDLLAKDAVIGWCQGRMEFGPRALGNRSIIGNPMSDKMQSKMNLKIKFRESFRPFAPAVLAEDVGHYFDLESTSPYMLVVAPVKESQHVPLPPEEAKLFGIDKLNVVRSKIPAVTHVDYTARVQTVHRETNPRFHRLISDFKKRTGCGVLVNTSFNVRGEPIVCDVEDAYRCFMRTEMDYLVVDDFLLAKAEQPHFSDREWQRDFELD